MPSGSETALDRAAIDAVDSRGMIADLLDLPNQLRDALWRVETARIAPIDAPGGLIVAGMGGSAIGGELAAAALGDVLGRPLSAARGYALPTWATDGTAVLCASYSGDTEETLACYEAAGVLGSPRIVMTTGGRLAELARRDQVPVIPLPGGFQARSAVAYSFVVALEVAAICGVGPTLHSEIDVAAARAEELIAAWGPAAAEDSEAKQLARELLGSIAVITGAGLTKPLAYRWKSQLNVNSKVPAFANDLPELDHVELAGWAGSADYAKWSAILLDDCDLHPRMRDRIELTAELIGEDAHAVHRIQTRGSGRIERLISLLILGDLVSLYLAVLRGEDPTHTVVIDRLKDGLAARS